MKNKTKIIDWEKVKSRLQQSQLSLEKALAPDEERLQTVYRVRAEQLARRRLETRRAAETVPVLVVVLGSERYAIELDKLVAIHPFTDCTPLPGAPPELLGVVNLRGEIRSVVDLGRLLHLPDPEMPMNDKAERKTGYLLLLRCRELEVAMRVDQVDTVQPFARRELSEPGEFDSPLPARFLKARSAERVLLLDVEMLFAEPLFRTRST